MEIVNHIIMIDDQARIRRKPHLKAKMVARMFIWEHQPIEIIIEQYELTASEVHSAIAYYYDNQEALDAEYERAISEIDDQAMTLNTFKTKIANKQTPQSDEQ